MVVTRGDTVIARYIYTDRNRGGRTETRQVTRNGRVVSGSPLLYSVFQNAGRSWLTGSELVWQRSFSLHVSLNANANAYRNTVGAFTVVNQCPEPVTYTAERQSLVSGNLEVNATFMLPRGRDTRVSSAYLAADLLPQGRIESRFSLDFGAKEEHPGREGRARGECDRPAQHHDVAPHDPRDGLPAGEYGLSRDAGGSGGVHLEMLAVAWPSPAGARAHRQERMNRSLTTAFEIDIISILYTL